MPDKNYAFVELRSVEETSNALCLDGVAFKVGARGGWEASVMLIRLCLDSIYHHGVVNTGRRRV